jgi:hypothetical protein
MALMVAAGSASAQLGKHEKKKPAAPPPAGSTPMVPAAPVAAPPADLTQGPYVVKERGRDVVLRVRLVVNSDSPNDKTYFTDPFTKKTVELPKITPFKFTSLSVLWPAIPSTASSDQSPGSLTGRLSLNDAVISDKPTLIDGYPGGVQFARFDTGNQPQETTCRQVELIVEEPMRVYRTRFDEQAALLVPWPTGPWPAEAASIMKPQLFLEAGLDASGAVRPYEDKTITAAMDTWFKEAKLSDPHGVTPVALAKILTAKVWGAIQVSGEGRASKDRTGEFAGLMLNPPSVALENGRANEHEVAALLATILRKAGLPARVVIGWEGGTGDAKFLQKSSTKNQVRSWVEFCLYDEAKNTINWVPVDPARLRRMGSRPFALERKWNFFGDHDELDGVLPFAFQFTPPTDVASYGYPAFWGWFATPQPPREAEQALTFDAATASASGDDLRSDKNKKNKAPPEVKRGN